MILWRAEVQERVSSQRLRLLLIGKIIQRTNDPNIHSDVDASGLSVTDLRKNYENVDKTQLRNGRFSSE